MSIAVEANSLSSLTVLAADPPQYPKNPTHVLREPLVLYIARVPGSRDVFLTPMKPKEKVVSAEDITSSLYYLHIDQPEDADMLQAANEGQDLGQTITHQEQTAVKPALAITRKPVPPARPSSDGVIRPFDVPRKPPSSAPASVSPPSKPLGARPLVPRKDAEQRHNIAASAPTLDAHTVEQDSYPRRSFEEASRPSNENIDPRGMHFQNPFSSENQRFGVQPANTPPYTYSPGLSSRPSAVSFADLNESLTAASPGVSLTLIRRDPGSGAQWNVAKIRDGTVSDAGTSHRGPKQPGAPIYLEILTPGYSKFLYNDEPPPLAARDSGLSAKSVDSVRTSRSAGSRANPQSGSKYFHRRLRLEGSGRFNSFSRDRKGSNDRCPFSDRPKSGGELGGRKSYDLERDDYFANPSGGEGYGEHGRSRFRGYVFTSPWGGRCEFTTGHTGKTLKCNHLVPGGPGQGAAHVGTTVSELRFNLPSTLFGSSRSPGKDHSKRPPIFSKSRHMRNNSSVSSIDAQDLHDRLDRLDLSLGQERAGGGFGGKQAKLGKLILEDEGQKMMDLIVAANMGLWWRAYERSDGQKK